MEISSIPFLNQEEYSYFYSFFQELDSAVNNPDANMSGSAKRRRRLEEEEDEEEGEGAAANPLNDILSTISFLEEDPNKFLSEQQREDNFDFSFYQLDQQMLQEKEEEQPPPPPPSSSNFEFFGSNSIQQPVAAAAAAAATVGRVGKKSPRRYENSNVGEDSFTIGGGGNGGQQRRLWVKGRSKAWWEYYSSDDCPEEDFRKAFRMSKATFNMICDELDSAVTKKDTTLRLAIPVRQRVAVCLYRLATGDPLRTVSGLFGLGVSTCHKLVLEVCAAIKSVLMPKFLQWPDDEKMRHVKTDFQSMSGIPNVGGSIYTTHISIISPKVNAAAYFNKKHTERNQKPSYSTTVQGVVDSRGVFTDICIGWPGSMSDDKILEKSALSQLACMGQLRDVWIVGNSGYPITDWTLVPYTHQNLTWSQHSFNEKIGEVQSVAKEAFIKLKGRWTCLQKRTEVQLQDLPVVLGACCVLHNICEIRGEEMDLDLRFDLFDDEMVVSEGSKGNSLSVIQARDTIAHNLLHHNNRGGVFR